MAALELSALDEGLIVGILIGEGHFGGDGRQPQITLRMHVRHEALLRWLHARIPRSRLYGPYHHGDRHYFQWMARGPALTQDLMPILERHIGPDLDGHTHARLAQMRERYADVFNRAAARAAREAATPAATDTAAAREAATPAATDTAAAREAATPAATGTTVDGTTQLGAASAPREAVAGSLPAPRDAADGDPSALRQGGGNGASALQEAAAAVERAARDGRRDEPG